MNLTNSQKIAFGLSIAAIVVVFFAALYFSGECENIINGGANLVAIIGESFVYAGVLLLAGFVVGSFFGWGTKKKVGAVASNLLLWGVVILVVGLLVSPSLTNFAQQMSTEACITGISGPY